jgi:mono/diheme cytochrome c family protein
MRMINLTLIALTALTGMALAAVPDPVERGRELFNSTRLGTNGKSCSTCHPNGIKMEETASYDDGELIKVINQCIKESLAGKPPAAKSADMQALVAYIRSVVNRQ